MLPQFATEFFARLKTECVPRIEKVTVPFYGIQDGQLKRDRTGVLYRIGGHHFILTAAHDLRGIVENNIPLYIDRTDSSTLPIPIVGAVFHTTEEKGRDVAAIKLPDDVVEQLGPNKEFLTQGDIRLTDKDANSLYLVFGYPEDWFGVAAQSAVVSNPLVYACRPYEGETDPNAYCHPDVHIVLEFVQTAVSVPDEGSHELPDLHGVSGCGIWRVAEWSKEGFQRSRPDQVCLVALQHSWYRQRKYIKGTWLGHALALIQDNYPDVSAPMSLVYPKVT